MFGGVAWWPVVMIVVLICVSLVQRVLKPSILTLQSDYESPSIFVSVVSYCDGAWVDGVVQMFEQAARPGRIFVGVIEFVHTAEESSDHLIPMSVRRNVRVHTVSKRIAKSQRETRKLCYDQLYKEEEYVLFSRGINLTDGWDELLISMITSQSVLTTMVPNEFHAVFPCANSRGGITHKFFQVQNPVPVPSLVVSFDFIFAPAEATGKILSSSNEWDVTASLVDNDYGICTPGTAIGYRSTIPRGVRPAKKLASVAGAQHAATSGFGNRPTARGRLGITAHPEPVELIAKCGSLVAARVEIQTIEAEDDAQSKRNSRDKMGRGNDT